MIRVRLEQQVLDFVRKLPPEPRKRLRIGLRGLAREEGDLVPLTDQLDGFHRLRVGSYRIIFAYATDGDGKRRIDCVFAGQRKWVYEVFQSRLME